VTDLSLTDLELVINRQKALGRRLIWLLLAPFFMTAVLVYMFIKIDSHVSNIAITEKLINIESILSRDSNYAWGISEYEIIANSHRNAPILARLGALYFLANPKDSDRALATLMEANRLDPQSWEPYRELAFVYTSIDKPREAIEAGAKAIELNSLDANTYNNLAWVYSHSKDSQYRNLNEALRDANNAVSYTKGKYPDYLDTLAQVYIQLGDPKSKRQAFELLKKAALIAPNDKKSSFIKDLQDHFPEEKLDFQEEKLEAEK
jgi:tetratricopeptide (TPR) repeat protein